MRSRLSLRARFIAGLLLVVILISGGFYYAVYQFVEVLEAELMETAVKRELHEFVDLYRRLPAVPPQHADGLRAYVLEAGAAVPADFPPRLLSWPVGRFGAVKFQGKEFYAGREDVGTTRLFMVLDISTVESLESRLVGIAYIVIIGALILAILVGLLLSRLVTRPVTDLAALVASLDPSTSRIRLGDRFGDRDIGVIAAAFDRYLERMEDFIARERTFTDDASHELRTPLAVVRSSIPLLQEEAGLSPGGRERLARIERAARQMQTLIEALLFLAREDGGWKAEPCALDEILLEIADGYRDTVAEKSLSLHCEIVEPRVIHAPPGMAACVVGNLVGNALQHTDKGRIDLRLEAGRIVVQDTGPGISAADLPRLFERRYRGPQSRGLGLGLYLVNRICDRLGWRIEVSSAPGTGARSELFFD